MYLDRLSQHNVRVAHHCIIKHAVKPACRSASQAQGSIRASFPQYKVLPLQPTPSYNYLGGINDE